MPYENTVGQTNGKFNHIRAYIFEISAKDWEHF